MIGAGAADMAGNLTVGLSDHFAAYGAADPCLVPGFSWTGTGHHGHPDWTYRIIMGIGPDCSLVTDGTVAGAALSPGSKNKSKYNYYCIVMPRLKATVDRLAAGDPRTIDITGDSNEQKTGLRIDLVQEPWEYNVIGPDGKPWPAEKNDYWTITSP